jgi:hypothetical protein
MRVVDTRTARLVSDRIDASTAAATLARAAANM